MSFQTKLFLVFAPFFVIVVALMLFFTIQFERHIIRQFESDIQDIVHTVHYSTQKLATRKGRDFEALERFIEEMKSDSRVREVSVVGSTQKIVASTNPKKVGQQSSLLSGKEIIVRAQYGAEDSGGTPVRYDFVQVPIIRDNKVIGMLDRFNFVNDFGILARQLKHTDPHHSIDSAVHHVLCFVLRTVSPQQAPAAAFQRGRARGVGRPVGAAPAQGAR